MMPFFILAAVIPLSGCRAIQHGQILGRDLASAAPELQALPPDSDFGAAPLPGSTRVFQVRELRRIAAENRIQADFSQDVCFVWRMRQLSRESVAEAMRKALAPRNVRIEILDQSSWPAPDGELCFARSGMSLGSGGVALWRGYVSYASTRRFEVWARARISVKETHFTTTEKLVAGHPLVAVQLKSESYDGALTREEPFTAIEQVLGMIPKFDISAGTMLSRQLLDVPHDIERGDPLTVVAEIGRARVEAACVAEESGRAGSIIAVHNARTGRRFRVVVQARGKAVVLSTDALGLFAEDVRQ
jgi:flagella basal body P-ring formation protein FlgA